MKNNQFTRELNDEELKDVTGSMAFLTSKPTNFSIGTSVNTTASAIGNHTDYVIGATQSQTVANTRAGVSYAFGFALAMAF